MLFIKETNEWNLRKHLENVSFTYKVIRVGDYLFAVEDVRDVANKSSWITYEPINYFSGESKKVLKTFREPSHFLQKSNGETKVETDVKIRLLFEKTYHYDNGDGYDTGEVQYADEDNEKLYEMENIRYERLYFMEHQSDRSKGLMDIYDWSVIVAHKPINGASVIEELPLMRKAHDEYDFDTIASYTAGTFLAKESKGSGFNNYILCPSFEHGKYNVINKD